MIPEPEGLSATERERYERDGFVGPLAAWPAQEMEALRKAVDSWLEERSPIYHRRTTRDWHLVSARLLTACLAPAMLRCVQEVLGDDVLLWRTNFRRKPPGCGPLPWHRDWDFRGPQKRPAIEPAVTVSCWLALHRATKENGCLRFLPGSHRTGTWVPPGSRSGRRDEIIQVAPDDDRVREVELEPGQFVLFHNGVVHGSGPNQEKAERLGVAIRFTSASTRVYGGQSVDGMGYDLSHWHAIRASGDATETPNVVGAPPTGEPRAPGPLRRMVRGIRRRRAAARRAADRSGRDAEAVEGEDLAG